MRALSDKMQKTWADFAKNPSGFNGWPKVVSSGGSINNSAIVVWREDGPKQSTFLEADGQQGTEGCIAIDRVLYQIPDLLEHSVVRK